MARFKIFYSDGSIADSRYIHHSDVPVYGVVVILQEIENGQRQLLFGHDFFYWSEEDNWRNISWDGVLDRLLHRMPIKYFLQGRQVSNTEFLRIYTLANSDNDITNADS